MVKRRIVDAGKRPLLTARCEWSAKELKRVLRVFGPCTRDELIGVLPMGGREISEARMEASFSLWLTKLVAKGKIEWDSHDYVRLRH